MFVDLFILDETLYSTKEFVPLGSWYEKSVPFCTIHCYYERKPYTTWSKTGSRETLEGANLGCQLTAALLFRQISALKALWLISNGKLFKIGYQSLMVEKSIGTAKLISQSAII